MKKNNYLFLFLITLILSCNTKEYDLGGEWCKIDLPINNHAPPPPFHPPFGIGFSGDQIEYLNGFIRYEKDTVDGKVKLNYKGNFTDYKINIDSIFMKNPFTQEWEFKWKIKELQTDTLILTKNDSSFITFYRIKNETKINFDQIIFSRSGCYGSCPIIDISIDDKNNVLFQGEGYVKPLGFYGSKIDSAKTNYIFSKFGKANIDSLSNGYYAEATDGESVTVTFVKNGRIIKTVHDYGKEGPSELVWSYVPIENLYAQIKWDTLSGAEPFYPKLYHYKFEKDSLILRLEKSESFFLWTELRKATIVNKSFVSKYSVWFSRNYTYWGTDPNDRKDKYSIRKIESDGQLFKFSFENRESITYDLGYSFVERNFDASDFEKKTEYD